MRRPVECGHAVDLRGIRVGTVCQQRPDACPIGLLRGIGDGRISRGRRRADAEADRKDTQSPDHRTNRLSNSQWFKQLVYLAVAVAELVEANTHLVEQREVQ